MNFNDKVVIITGAAQGIGAAIAKLFCEHNATVVMIDVEEETLERTGDSLKAEGGEVITRICDITVSTKVQEVVDNVVAELGKIDVLVNNAGITKDNLIIRTSEEDWEQVLKVNLNGVFNFSKSVIKYMLKQRSGKVVNISSVVGMTGNAGQISYSTTKAGLIGFTKTLAKEVGKRGICVNAVAPGFIETRMTEQLGEAARDYFLNRIPLGRAGTPEDVAKVVLFLASTDSNYITGEVIKVDGGMT